MEDEHRNFFVFGEVSRYDAGCLVCPKELSLSLIFLGTGTRYFTRSPASCLGTFISGRAGFSAPVSYNYCFKNSNTFSAAG